MPWTVYVLVSDSAGATYVGITTDLERRLAEHNGLAPRGAKATRAGRPWSIGATYGPYEDRSEAQRIEYLVKLERGPARLALEL